VHRIFGDAASTPPGSQPPEPLVHLLIDIDTLHDYLDDPDEVDDLDDLTPDDAAQAAAAEDERPHHERGDEWSDDLFDVNASTEHDTHVADDDPTDDVAGAADDPTQDEAPGTDDDPTRDAHVAHDGPIRDDAQVARTASTGDGRTGGRPVDQGSVDQGSVDQGSAAGTNAAATGATAVQDAAERERERWRRRARRRVDPRWRRCETIDGHPVPAGDIIRAMIRGQVRRVVRDDAGVVIHLGRRRRLFTGNARAAVLLASTSCIWPGCNRPTTQCQADHLTDWQHLGTTDPDNGAPLCARHNRFKNRGFTTQRDDEGSWHTLRPDGTEI
jgi:hypothetical protein